MATPAAAHPHAWIDITVSVIFDEAGNISGLEQNWLFDEYFTVYSLEDRDANGDGEIGKEELTSLGRDFVRNLSDYAFFTEVKQGDARLEFDGAEMLDMTLRDGARLALTFRLDLAEPQDATETPVSYSVYDPSYYTEVLHVDEASILMTGHPPAACRTALTKPNPTMEMVALAGQLDQMEQGPDTLGAQFAETVTIDCQPNTDSVN